MSLNFKILEIVESAVFQYLVENSTKVCFPCSSVLMKGGKRSRPVTDLLHAKLEKVTPSRFQV